jgi:hypothetical protein
MVVVLPCSRPLLVARDRVPGITIKLVELAVMDPILRNSFKGLIKMNPRAGIAHNSVKDEFLVSLAIYNYKKKLRLRTCLGISRVDKLRTTVAMQMTQKKISPLLLPATLASLSNFGFACPH